MGMQYHISFGVAGMIVLVVMLVATKLRYAESSPSLRAFVKFVWTLLLASFLDVVSAVGISYASMIPDAENIVLSTAYFAASGVCQFFLVDYVRAYTKDSVLGRTMIWIDRVIMTVYLLLVFSSVATGWLFTFENGVYVHGPVYAASFIVPAYFMIGALSLALANRQLFTRSQILSSIFFVIVTLGCMLIQVFVVPDVLLAYFGASISALFLMFALETPDYQKLMRTMNDLEYLRQNLQVEVKKQTELAIDRQHHLEELSLQTIQALAHAIDAKDEYTNGHSTRVAQYAVLLARELGWDENRVRDLQFAAMLHDIGKIGVPDTILNKPGRLNDVEYAVIQTHTTVGAGILENVTSLPLSRTVAMYHHERWDGHGYPSRLAGTDIPEEARLLAIADSYDAMTSDRVYRPALTPEKSRQELVDGRGSQFDPDMVDVFLRLVDAGAVDAVRESGALEAPLMSNPLLTGAGEGAHEETTIDAVIAIINDTVVKSGPSEVPYQSVAERYKYLANLSARYDKKLSVVLFTLRDYEGVGNAPLHESALAALDMAIRQCVRAMDMYSRLNESQFLIALSGADEADAKDVAKRVIKSYYHYYDKGDIAPDVEIRVIGD